MMAETRRFGGRRETEAGRRATEVHGAPDVHETADRSRATGRTRPPHRAGACLLALVLAGCASAGPPIGTARDDPGARSSALPPAEFIIESHHPGPVTVHATYGALRIRLATVTAWRTARIPVPPEMIGNGRVVRLVARATGDRREVVTEAVAVQAGDRVFWTVTQPIERSVATLRVQLGDGT